MFHVLSASQFDRKQLDEILERAKKMEEMLASGEASDLCKGKIMAALFYEPSTRTRLSFESAMMRLGGNVISETDVTFSSQAKGEALADTIRVIDQYSDVIVLRTKQEGNAQIAMDHSSVPIINGGDGAGEHPTQSLLDLYTISQFFDLDQKITISFVGDCRYSRTIHSLSKILRTFPQITINFVAPEEVQIPKKYLEESDGRLLSITKEVLAQSDIVYTQRIQKERFEDQDLAEKLSHEFIFDLEKAQKMPLNSIILDPLPRINTIAFEVDKDPRAKYFQQAFNGVPMRMALIDKAING